MAELNRKWLSGISDESKEEVHKSLRTYALKHAIGHLVDVPKQQENVGNILCNLQYIKEKLSAPDTNLNHLLDDYKHQHSTESKDGPKSASLADYMKRQPKTLEQIGGYYRFLHDCGNDLKQNPGYVLQVAANYAGIERIQQNARVELDTQSWIENVTAAPETHCVIRHPKGVIRAVDLAPDGKTVAVVCKDDDYNLFLNVYNTTTGGEKMPRVEIKNLKDRYGVVCKFHPDGQKIFVGSMSTYIALSGMQVPSHLDLMTIQMAEKFSIECCDISPKFLMCGLSTFPWGGRSLHICVFDLKSKKCVKTIEVLRFNSGGSAQFGIRAVALAKEKPYMCACVKQSAKKQLRIMIWNTSKFQVINSIEVENDDFTKCTFVDDRALLIGAGIRSGSGAQSRLDFLPVTSELWEFKEVTNKATEPWDTKEYHSLFSSLKDGAVCTRWYKPSGNPMVAVWKGPAVKGQPTNRFLIRNLHKASELVASGECLCYIIGDELRMYTLGDLESLEAPADAKVIPNISDVVVESFSFMPKSDTAVIVTKEESEMDEKVSVYTCDTSQVDMTMSGTPFINESRPKSCNSMETIGPFSYFSGIGACTDLAFPSADGSCLIFNGYKEVKIWDKVNDRVRFVPRYEELGEKSTQPQINQLVKAVGSPKDNIISVVYAQLPTRIYIYDAKSGALINKFDKENQKSTVADFAFMPSNGYLLSYHRDCSLSAWNAKSGQSLNTDQISIAYAQTSQASDRIAISKRTGKRAGELILRNSDKKFCSVLTSSGIWLPSRDDSDVEFSLDGTILIGVCAEQGISRVWNAGNGENLQDLNITFSSNVEIGGMLTNTHVLLLDERVLVVDIGTGEVCTVMPLEERLERKSSNKGLKVSQRGMYIAGARTSGQMVIFRCHNFSTVKRKTTLQRLKSFIQK